MEFLMNEILILWKFQHSLTEEGREGVKWELGLAMDWPISRLGKWDWGYWDWDLATGNGK